jgi:hypothetical protein
MLQFTQEEVEKEIADILVHNDRAEVSRITGIHISTIKQQLNPDDERKSFTYSFLQVLCALDQISPERGEQLWLKVQQFREMSRPASLRPLCVESEAVRNTVESTDVTLATMKGLPLYEQLAEVLEQIAQAKRHKQAIMDQINAEKATENGHRTRLRRAG